MFGLASAKNNICIFEGIMEFLFTDILESALIPSIDYLFPDGSHCLTMDNDPKHTSHHVADYLRDQDINWPWWKTPAESPDLNPIDRDFSRKLDRGGGGANRDFLKLRGVCDSLQVVS
jgi:hypothetical protein